MSDVQLGTVVQHLRMLAASEETRELSDHQLLDQFATRKEVVS